MDWRQAGRERGLHAQWHRRAEYGHSWRLSDGGHVVTTLAEHNSVLRPLAALQEAGRIQISRVPCDATGVVDPAEIRRAMHPTTRLVALTHASNVTGMIQPAAEVGALGADRGVLFLLDAAQTVGEIAIDVEQLHVDLLAARGTRDCLGPWAPDFCISGRKSRTRFPPFAKGEPARTATAIGNLTRCPTSSRQAT